MRRRLLTILFTLLAPFAAHAEWLIAGCSAYTPYDCGTITATGETVHVGGVACNFLPFGTVVVIDGVEYVVNDRCGIENCKATKMLSSSVGSTRRFISKDEL